MTAAVRSAGGALFALAFTAPLAPHAIAAAVDPIDRLRGFVDEASLRLGVPSEWIVRVIRTESGGQTTRNGRPIRSPKGAIGLMQLMPETWADMRTRLTLGSDPDDPHDNILAGTLYLRLMAERFGYPGCFAAYNAGPERYAAYLRGARRLPDETLAYLAKLGVPASAAHTVSRAQPRAAALPAQSLFVVRIAPEGGTAPAAQAPQPALFAIRHDDR